MSKKIKIAFFVDGGEGGGVVEYIRLLLINLDKNQFYVYGIFIGAGNSFDKLHTLFDETHILTKGRLVNYAIDNKKAIVFLKKLNLAFLSLYRLSTLIKKEDINIIDVNYFPHHIIAGLAAKVNRKACIWHWHGASTLNGLKKQAVILGVKYLSFRIIPISKFVESSLPKEIHEKSEVVYNGVEIHEITDYHLKSLTNLLNIPKQEKLIGIVGTLTPIKGHLDFIQAADIVLKHRSGVKFLIIGTETDAHKKRFNFEQLLKTKVAELGRENDIIFTGLIPNFSKHMSDLYLIVMPTVPIGLVKGEGFGLVAAEAMALGVPVIASNIGAFSEIISDKKDSILIEPGNPEKLAASIIDLLDHQNYRDTLSQAARIKIKNNFDIKKNVLQVEEIYIKSFNSRIK